MTKLLQICNTIIRNYKSLNLLKRNQFKETICAFSSSCPPPSNDSTNLEIDKEKSVLYRSLFSKIKTCGPITVADYMKEILIHPTAGYYTTKDVFGQKGDFVTSPEISQLFGEMLALWIINEWQKIDRNSFQLIELGPGRGTLIKDILRVFKQLKILHLISIHLVEISPVLSRIQGENLCTSIEENVNQQNSVSYYKKGTTEDGVTIYWYYSVTDVPTNFSVFVMHEFFDALPIHKFQKTDQGWNEVLVDIIPETKEEKFRYVLSKTPASVTYVSKDERRDHVEISPQSMVIVDYISSFLTNCGGFSLIVDYGHMGEKTDTFRAFKKHQLYDPLLNPGTADLTADVDFSVIKRIAEKNDRLITFGPISQQNFLKNLGIDIRLQMLLKNATDTQKQQILSGYHMITDEDKMGERFKVLALFPGVLKNHLKVWSIDGF